MASTQEAQSAKNADMRAGYRLTLWGPDARYISMSFWPTLSEATKVARQAGRRQAAVFSATVRTPRGKFHHFTF